MILVINHSTANHHVALMKFPPGETLLKSLPDKVITSLKNSPHITVVENHIPQQAPAQASKSVEEMGGLKNAIDTAMANGGDSVMIMGERPKLNLPEGAIITTPDTLEEAKKIDDMLAKDAIVLISTMENKNLLAVLSSEAKFKGVQKAAAERLASLEESASNVSEEQHNDEAE